MAGWPQWHRGADCHWKATSCIVEIVVLQNPSQFRGWREKQLVRHMRHGRNYLLAAVSLDSLRVPYRFPVFPSVLSSIVLLRVPYRLPWFCAFFTISMTRRILSSTEVIFDGTSYGYYFGWGLFSGHHLAWDLQKHHAVSVRGLCELPLRRQLSVQPLK